MSRYASIVGFPFTSGVSPINFDSFTVDNTTINENNVAGNTVIATVQTNNIKTDFVLYWTTTDITGTLTGSHFLDGVESGTFFVDATGKATITRTAKADNITNGDRQFKLQIRLGSVNGGLMIASPTITINDTSLSPIIATKNASLPTNIVQVINVASSTWSIFSSITGGLGSGYNYTPSPTLPSGLSVDTNGQLIGTPTVTSATTTYTITVNQTPLIAGQTAIPASVTFNMAVASTLLANYNIPVGTRYLPPNVLITPFVPVVAAGGWTPYTYALSGNTLPAGLSFNTSTGQITGTPTLLTGEAAKTYTVTIQDSATTNQIKTNTFIAQLVSTLTSTIQVTNRIVVISSTITNFTPVTPNGGSPIKTYAITPALPTGLSFDVTTGQVSGTPTVSTILTTYSVNIKDECLPRQSTTSTFTLAVSTILTATVILPTVYVKTSTATSFTPVTPTGGYTPLIYTATGLNGSLTVNSSGVVSGTASSTAGTASVTITIKDSTTIQQSKTGTFSLNTVAAMTVSVAISSRIFAVGTSVNYSPLSVSGGSPSKTYTSTSVLPSGLTLNSTTGAITGVVSGAATLVSTTITATDQCIPAQTGSGLTSIQVVDVLTVTPNPSIPLLTEGFAFTTFSTVTATGGTTTKTYSISPALPNGLGVLFNTSTGQITSGTPTVTGVRSSQSYTVTVTDQCSSPQVVTSAPFTITVQVPAQITFTQPTTYSWVVPVGVTSISVVCIGGGGGQAGLVYNGTSLVGGAGGGGGGATAYKNNVTVTSGSTLTIVAGKAGLPGSQGFSGLAGGNSTVTVGGVVVCNAGGGQGGAYSSSTVTTAVGGAGGVVNIGTGGVGGKGGDAKIATIGSSAKGGGGGAGGYAGAGGAGGADISGTTTNGSAGLGGGGGGGSGFFGASGGGVGLLGQGANGAGGVNSGGGGGSGGQNGAVPPYAGSSKYGGGQIGDGAVRIMWPGSTRQYPSTGVADTYF